VVGLHFGRFFKNSTRRPVQNLPFPFRLLDAELQFQLFAHPVNLPSLVVRVLDLLEPMLQISFGRNLRKNLREKNHLRLQVRMTFHGLLVHLNGGSLERGAHCATNDYGYNTINKFTKTALE
jgi:hypothetical protein